MIWEVCWDDLWTLSIGLSQFHGHSSWLVCEVALGTSQPVLLDRGLVMSCLQFTQVLILLVQHTPTVHGSLFITLAGSNGIDSNFFTL